MSESNLEKTGRGRIANRPTASFVIEKIKECEIQEFTNGNWLIIARGEKETEKKCGSISAVTMLNGNLTLTLNAVSDTSLRVHKTSRDRNPGNS